MDKQQIIERQLELCVSQDISAGHGKAWQRIPDCAAIHITGITSAVSHYYASSTVSLPETNCVAEYTIQPHYY